MIIYNIVLALMGFHTLIETKACDLKIKKIYVIKKIIRHGQLNVWGVDSTRGLKTFQFLQPLLSKKHGAIKIQVPSHRQCRIKEN